MTSADSTVDVAVPATSAAPSNRVEDERHAEPAVDRPDRGGPGQSGGPAVLEKLDGGDVVDGLDVTVDPDEARRHRCWLVQGSGRDPGGALVDLDRAGCGADVHERPEPRRAGT